MKCPSCRLENPPSALYCDCGHEFVPGSKPKGWTPEVRNWKDELFTPKRVLQSWGIGVVVTLAVGVMTEVAPFPFEIFALPFWILPVILRSGFHGGPNPFWGFLGSSIFYGAISFLVMWRVIRRKARTQCVSVPD